MSQASHFCACCSLSLRPLTFARTPKLLKAASTNIVCFETAKKFNDTMTAWCSKRIAEQADMWSDVSQNIIRTPHRDPTNCGCQREAAVAMGCQNHTCSNLSPYALRGQHSSSRSGRPLGVVTIMFRHIAMESTLQTR